jgi:hypothetical protein|tara:strand:+ start:56 stop:274 length:219 start_codon:yes stop_codon:yes gene_type:complete
MDNFVLLYAESLDAWILQTSDEIDIDGNIKGKILFVSKGLSKKEQIDELLDLILKKDDNQDYYEEILRIITQ